ncbi:MAG: hypothetical protein AB7T74_07570 [Clostridia bacterium]
MIARKSQPARPGWPVNPVCIEWFFWFVILVCAMPVRAQVSGHQRLGVQSKALWEADIELAVRLRSGGNDDYVLPDLDSSLSAGLLLDRKWSAGLSVPVRMSGGSGTGAPLNFVPGDVSTSVGWISVHGDNQVRGSLNLVLPSARWQGDQEVPDSVAGGSGRWTLGLSGGLSHIMDPLVLSGSLSWSLGLPRTERWGSRWRPGDFSLALSVTEAFNEHVSCTLGLSQYVSLPECAWNTPQAASWGSLPYGTIGYDAAVAVDYLFSWQSYSIGIGISKGLIHGAGPGLVGVSAGCSLR